ncbi:MAG: hypothetical protein ACI83P_001753, partial [Janthinobacterium sp.]
ALQPAFDAGPGIGIIGVTEQHQVRQPQGQAIDPQQRGRS